MKDDGMQFFGLNEVNEILGVYGFNEKQEWYAKLIALPTVRDFELHEWEEWGNFHFNTNKESKND